VTNKFVVRLHELHHDKKNHQSKQKQKLPHQGHNDSGVPLLASTPTCANYNMQNGTHVDNKYTSRHFEEKQQLLQSGKEGLSSLSRKERNVANLPNPLHTH
jgi:hypothetical protein